VVLKDRKIIKLVDGRSAAGHCREDRKEDL